MICPYCGVAFQNGVTSDFVLCKDEFGNHMIRNVYCTNCEKPIILLKSLLTITATRNSMKKSLVQNIENYYGKKITTTRTLGGQIGKLEKYKQIKPEFNYRNPIPKEVTDIEIIKDYTEACLTLNTSLRASAALSRRCLQTILEKNVDNLKSTNLSKQIDETIKTQNLPSSITDLLHAVREIGNISVHPTKDTTSNEIIETTFEEAELNLEVIESLFDYYYVMPIKNGERISRLNQKLTNAGRITIKN